MGSGLFTNSLRKAIDYTPMSSIKELKAFFV
jgi:hypothetical protein